jgi:hypothetical protein
MNHARIIATLGAAICTALLVIPGAMAAPDDQAAALKAVLNENNCPDSTKARNIPVDQRTPEKPITTKSTPKSVLPSMTVTTWEVCSRDFSTIGGYTRLYLVFVPAAGGEERVYDYERRNDVSRFFMGKAITRLLSVKMTLARPFVSMTTTLASVEHTSNKKNGENWTTELNNQRMLTPYFRIDPDTAMNIELNLSMSASYDSSIASNTLDIVKRATALIAPQASLVTSLNQDRFGQASQFLDQSLSSLLRESIVERASNDFPMRDWAGSDLAIVELRLPMHNDVTPTDKEPKQKAKPIGTWYLRSAPPILSIFSDALLVETPRPAVPTAGKKTVAVNEQCKDKPDELKAACKAFLSLDPQTVMNFPVDTNVTLAQSLAGDTGIGAARDTLIKAPAGEAMKDSVRNLCGLIADKAHVLGFNRFDISAILWAYSRRGFAKAETAKEMRDAANCLPLALAYDVGLRAGSF